MCVSKVANPGEGKSFGRGGDYGTEERNRVWESLVSPMLSGFDRERENSAIVSALAHVVAGDETTGDDNQEEQFSELMMMNQGGGGSAAFSNVDSGSSSPSSPWGVGEKRGRDDQGLNDVGSMPESSVSVAPGRAYNLPLIGSNLGLGMFNLYGVTLRCSQFLSIFTSIHKSISSIS